MSSRQCLLSPDESRELTRQLEQHLHARLFGRVKNVRVIQRDEGIVLKGEARTYYAKQLAPQAAHEFTCLPILANEIEVS